MKQNEDCAVFDARYAEAVGREVIGPLATHYFRLKVVGLEQLNLPQDGRATIFLANHAGRCLPWDAILLDYALGRYWVDDLGRPTKDKPRSLAAIELSEHPLLVPFRLNNWWRKVGCLDATARNFQQLVKAGKAVIIFPEGIAGIARDFRERYQLLPFSSSVVRMAAHYDARIVPISIVGPEYFHPYARRTKITDALAKKLQLPFLHLSPFLGLLAGGPWFFYMALPAPVTVVVGKPYQLENIDFTKEAEWETATEKLRQHCQSELNQARAHYERGWQWWGLVKSLLSAPEPFWKLLPPAWPHRFIKHAEATAPNLFPHTTSPWHFLLPVLGWFTFTKPFAPSPAAPPLEILIAKPLQLKEGVKV